MYKSNIFRYVQPSDQLPSNPKNGDFWWQTNGGKICRFANGQWSCDPRLFKGADTALLPLIYLSDFTSKVMKVNFPFDGVNYSSVGNLTSSTLMYGCTGCNSSIFGYFLGGQYPVNTPQNLMNKMNFATGLNATLIGNLTTSRCFNPSPNSSTFGYMMGGAIGLGSSVSSIERVMFAVDGNSYICGNLPIAKSGLAYFNDAVSGFSICGEVGTDGSSLSSSIHKILFPFDTGTATNVGIVTSATQRYGGGFNSSNYGFYHGGAVSDSVSNSRIERVSFPYNTGNMAVVGNLSVSKTQSATCNTTGFGYSMVGLNNVSGGAYYSSIDMIQFPFDSGVSIGIGNLAYLFSPMACPDNTDFVAMFV